MCLFCETCYAVRGPAFVWSSAHDVRLEIHARAQEEQEDADQHPCGRRLRAHRGQKTGQLTGCRKQPASTAMPWSTSAIAARAQTIRAAPVPSPGPCQACGRF